MRPSMHCCRRMLESYNDGNGDIWQDSHPLRFHGDGQASICPTFRGGTRHVFMNPVSPRGACYVLDPTTWQVASRFAKKLDAIGTPPMHWAYYPALRPLRSRHIIWTA